MVLKRIASILPKKPKRAPSKTAANDVPLPERQGSAKELFPRDSPRTESFGATEPPSLDSSSNNEPIGMLPTIKDKINDIIQRLLVLRDRPVGASCEDLTEEEIKMLCQQVRPVLLRQPMLLDIIVTSAGLKIVGDIHGQYSDLLLMLDRAGHPPESNYLFLGDYVDRGQNSIETICLLMCYKVLYPDNFFLLRGNHETEVVNRVYGFYDECKRRYTVKLYRKFCDVFNCLPVAALIEDRIFCMHGGLSPSLQKMSQIQDMKRPCEIPDEGLLADLLWSDPDPDITGWDESERGISYIFGKDVVEDYCSKFDLDLIVRAHQVVEDGYEFFAQRQLVTIFSAPHYCGEFDNAAAMIVSDENLQLSFQVFGDSNYVNSHGGEG